MGLLLGLHASPLGHTQRSIDTFAAANPAVCLWLAGNHQPQDALRQPGAWHLVRLPTPAVDESVGVYVRAMERLISPWRSVESSLAALWFIPGNEAEYSDGSDVLVAWDIDAWLRAAPNYAAALREMYPGIRLAAPALMAQHTESLTLPYTTVYDAITCHCYWQQQDEPGIRWYLSGASYRAALACAFKDVPVIATEVGVVSPSGRYDDASEMDWPTRNRQIATWIGEAEAAGVAACCLFVVDASPDFACFDLGPESVAEILSLRHPAPVDPPLPPPPPEEPTMGYTREADPRGYRSLHPGWRPFIAAHNAEEADAICNAYEEGCRAIDYDANCAAAQGCVETAIFTSPRWVNAHAAAGVGIYGDDTPDVIWGHSKISPHGTVGAGIQAQLALLNDYYGDGNDPWGVLTAAGFGFDTPLGKTRLAQMDGVWAADRGYSAAIIGVANEVMGGTIPSPAPQPQPPPDHGGVTTLEAIYQRAVTYLGRTTTREGYGEFGMCEQFIEEVVEDETGERVRYASAAEHGDAVQAAGMLRTGPWPRGAVLLWGRGFDPSGHTSIGADYPLTITTFADRDPTTIDEISLIDTSANGWLGALMGWYVPDGASESGTTHKEVDVLIEGHLDDGMIERLWYGNATKAKRKKIAYNPQSGIGQRWKKELLDGHPLGVAQSGEETDADRVVQFFSNGALTYVKATGETFVN